MVNPPRIPKTSDICYQNFSKLHTYYYILHATLNLCENAGKANRDKRITLTLLLIVMG